MTAIGSDHLDWLTENEQTIEKIVYEKTSSLLNSKIVIAKQDNKKTMDSIKKNISSNNSKKIIFDEQFSFAENENGFIYYEDEIGGLKLPKPNLIGEFQIENIATAIATIRSLNLKINLSLIFCICGLE